VEGSRELKGSECVCESMYSCVFRHYYEKGLGTFNLNLNRRFSETE
jgi:hypothetical protein